jgi:hypothetical protein
VLASDYGVRKRRALWLVDQWMMRKHCMRPYPFLIFKRAQAPKSPLGRATLRHPASYPNPRPKHAGYMGGVSRACQQRKQETQRQKTSGTADKHQQRRYMARSVIEQQQLVLAFTAHSSLSRCHHSLSSFLPFFPPPLLPLPPPRPPRPGLPAPLSALCVACPERKNTSCRRIRKNE